MISQNLNFIEFYTCTLKKGLSIFFERWKTKTKLITLKNRPKLKENDNIYTTKIRVKWEVFGYNAGAKNCVGPVQAFNLAFVDG